MTADRSVKVLRTLTDLEEIRGEWESWPGNRDSDRHAYLTLLDSRAEVLRPHVVVVYRDGQPDAMLVGRMERARLDFKVGYVHFRPEANILYFVYGGPRGNASFENCELLIRNICKSLGQGEADAAYLNFTRMDSELYQFAKKMPGFLNRDHTSVTQAHFAAAIPDTVDAFYARLSANARWQAKSKQKKLEKAFPGSVTIRCFREPEEIERLVCDAETVARTSYQRGLRVGFSDSPEMRTHLQLKAEKGWLQGYILYLGNRPCAFWIGDINGTTFGSDYLGYDAEFARYSPGMYLMMKVIEGFCKDGTVTEVDFATGHAQYKEVLASQQWREASLYIFASSLKGCRLSLLRFLTGNAENILKKVLSQAGVLQQIKKNWRAQARRKQAAEAGV